MRLPWFDAALWAAGPIVNAVLLAVLFVRRRLPQFSSLALWSAYSVLIAAILFWASHVDIGIYARVYWIAEAVDALLQLLIVAQVAWIVFVPLHQQVRRQWKGLIALLGGFTVGASLLALSVTPPAHSRAGVLEIRGQLFTSILICCVFTYVLFVSQKRGLYWRSHVMSVGYGLTAWAIVSLALDLLHGYLGRSGHFLALEHVRMLVYLCILLYWIASLWRNEPRLQTPPPEMRNAILQKADQVSYDLAQVLGARDPGKELH